MATNSEIIQDAYAGFARGDVPAVLAPCPKTSSGPRPTGSRWPARTWVPGPSSTGSSCGWARSATTLAVMPETFVAEGDTVVALGSYTWTHKSTGKPAVVKMAHVWTLADGKAVAFQQHTDTLRVRDLS